MSEKEKVMTVTLMRSDLYDAPYYIGVYLKLPANQDEIQDALHRARIRDNQLYQIVECWDMQGEELDFIPNKPSLVQLNFLAHRISGLSEHDRMAFAGCARMGNGNLGMQNLINQTYNLSDVHVILAGNDRELGTFYVENGFIDAVNQVPPKYQVELRNLLDYKKIGCMQREAEGGIFHNGSYVMSSSGSWETVYDGLHLPEMPEEPPFIFKLQLAKDGLETDNSSEPEHKVSLLLPANDKEILAVLEQLGAASLDECVFYHCESPVPILDQAFSFHEDIHKMNHFAQCIRELQSSGELVKCKAVLEYSDCVDIDQVLELTQNLDCFDFYPELFSPEDYAKQEFLKRYQIPENDPTLVHIQFSRCAPDLAEPISPRQMTLRKVWTTEISTADWMTCWDS
ncbi:antirestriction protein ArdA [uncultured Oscillibacter sp.]|uniref:antirestriction protein ArdA n=1 Tax=uncultured Oscillibacter sp. TaxID=876091 RepID=UPI0025D62DE9|nr:antirestriction protein ArdA [uncultured Oscillibacter sp.]